jgi:hypothetical protein
MAVVFFTDGLSSKKVGQRSCIGMFGYLKLENGMYSKLNWATHTVEARNMEKISILGACAL